MILFNMFRLNIKVSQSIQHNLNDKKMSNLFACLGNLAKQKPDLTPLVHNLSHWDKI